MRRRRRGRPASDRAAADAHPVAGDGDDGARFRGRPERQAPAGLRLHRPARVSAYPRDREVGTAGPGRAPNADRDRPRRYARRPLVRRCLSGRDERGVAALGHAVRGGEDQITCGRVQHSAGAGVQRAAAQKHRAHPRIGRHRRRVGGVLGVTVAASSTGGCFPHAEPDKVNAASSPVTRTARPAAEKCMRTDLAITAIPVVRPLTMPSPTALWGPQLARASASDRGHPARNAGSTTLCSNTVDVRDRIYREHCATLCARRRARWLTTQINQNSATNPSRPGCTSWSFPAPQLSSADGRGPVMIHALEGFSDAGHAIRLAAAAPQEHAGHRAGGVVRHRRTAGLPVAAAADDVQDRPLHPLRGTRAEPVRAARQRRHTVSAARGHGAGPALGALHHRGAAAGRAAGRAPDHRPGHHPDGGPAHPADHADRARQRQGTDRRPHSRGWARCRSPAACPTCWSSGWPSTVTRWSGSPCTCRTIWPRPTTPPPPRRCSPRSPRPARCRSRWPRWPRRQPRCTTKINEQVEASSEVAQVVEALERQYDAFVAAQENRSLLARDEDLPSGDELGAEFERFLAQQAGTRTKASDDDDVAAPARQRSWRHDRDDKVGAMTERKPNLRTGARTDAHRCSSAPSTATGARSGSPDPGPAILLIHGIGDNSTTWSTVQAKLAQRFTVIAPDLLGHGKSDKPRADYSVAAYANGMRDLLSVLDIERVTVVGHSLGGGVAMQFAYQFPQLVDRLILVGAGGVTKDVNFALRFASLPMGSEALALLRLPLVLPAVQAAGGSPARLLGSTGAGPRPARRAADPARSARADRLVGVRPHAAGRRGLARPGGHHARPMLFDGIRSGATDLGLARFGDPGQPRPDGARRDARFAAGDLRGLRAFPVPRRPRPLRRGRRAVHRFHRTRRVRPGHASRSAARRHQRGRRSPDRSTPGSRCSTRWAPTSAAPPDLHARATS